MPWMKCWKVIYKSHQLLDWVLIKSVIVVNHIEKCKNVADCSRAQQFWCAENIENPLEVLNVASGKGYRN